MRLFFIFVFLCFSIPCWSAEMLQIPNSPLQMRTLPTMTVEVADDGLVFYAPNKAFSLAVRTEKTDYQSALLHLQNERIAHGTRVLRLQKGPLRLKSKSNAAMSVYHIEGTQQNVAALIREMGDYVVSVTMGYVGDVEVSQLAKVGGAALLAVSFAKEGAAKRKQNKAARSRNANVSMTRGIGLKLSSLENELSISSFAPSGFYLQNQKENSLRLSNGKGVIAVEIVMAASANKAINKITKDQGNVVVRSGRLKKKGVWQERVYSGEGQNVKFYLSAHPLKKGVYLVVYSALRERDYDVGLAKPWVNYIVSGLKKKRIREPAQVKSLRRYLSGRSFRLESADSSSDYSVTIARVQRVHFCSTGRMDYFYKMASAALNAHEKDIYSGNWRVVSDNGDPVVRVQKDDGTVVYIDVQKGRNGIRYDGVFLNSNGSASCD